MSKRSEYTILFFYVLLTAALVMAMPFVGVSQIQIRDIISGADPALSTIFWELRLPRVILAFVVGAGLSLSGVIFQAFFRNDLASPFTLGISSAAALGAAVYFKFAGTALLLGMMGAPASAFIGAIGGIAFIYLLSARDRRLEGNGLLLAGVALSFFCSSLVVFIQYIADVAEIFSITRWLMGSVETIGFEKVMMVTPVVLAAAAVTFLYGRELDLIAVGDEFAISRGVRVSRTRQILFAAACLMVALIVSFCGVIGFVGIMVPHIARRLTGLSHRTLALSSFFIGGCLLMACDALARIMIAPSEIPVGVITSIIGGPFFLLLLTTRVHRHGEAVAG
ncbi:MAG: iron ABC transporter permease [Deltaproteobacteria bacterium]|nr:iron ABC transporter permease [Deltaproteobacteria bacterium]